MRLFCTFIATGQVVLLERGPPRKAGVDSDSEINQPMSRIPRQEWEWSIGHTVRIHTHDVRALAIHEPSIESRPSDGRVRKGRTDQVLVSGGLDTSLSLYSVPGFKRLVSMSSAEMPVDRIFASLLMCSLSRKHAAPSARFVLVQRYDRVDGLVPARFC